MEILGWELSLGAEDLEGTKLGVRLGSLDGSRLGAAEMLGCELSLGAEDSEGAKLGVWLGALDKLG